MTDTRLRGLLRLNAALYLLLGALLLLSSWDDLFENLELPRPQPALFAQVGGVATLGLAYLLWTGVGRDLAVAAIGMNSLAAALLVLWLFFRDLDIWGVDALGYTLLSVLLALLAGLAVAEALALTRRRAPNP
jgi:hypothetical protein